MEQFRRLTHRLKRWLVARISTVCLSLSRALGWFANGLLHSDVLLRWFEFIADFPDGVDEDGIVRVGFDFVAQRRDESVDAALTDETIVAPDSVEDIIAGQRPAGLFDEQLKKLEFLR